MTRQGTAHCHHCCLRISDFANHDNVGIMAHQLLDAFGIGHVLLVIDLQLYIRRINHFHGIFQGIDFSSGNTVQQGIERGCLTRSGRS